ncbi:MAG: hypothetical protein JWP19_494 [Rhodoglobus sp.]|nr:hypothetical protein [Rhodoglobus sp.]
MADDDEVGEDFPFDPTFATAGPRRSTFTPPTGSSPVQPPAVSLHDDDALADALAADLTRLNTGVFPVIEHQDAPDSAPAPPLAAEPAQQEPAAYQPPVQPASEPQGEVPPVSDPPASATPPWSAPAPWAAFPAPDPSQAVQLPDPPDRPVRRSLPDDELLNLVDDASREHGATLDVIEQLQSQLELREQEAREFSAWESNMRLLGTPDAMAAVEDARPDFNGVLPAPPQSPAAPSFIDPEHVTAWPLPSYPEDEGNAPAPLPYADEVDDEVLEETQQYEVPPSALPAWEVPAPGPNWSPGPDYDLEPVPVPEPEPEPVPEPQPVHEPEPEPVQELAPEPEPEPSWQPDFEDAAQARDQDEVVEAELLPETAPEAAVAPAEPAPYAPPPLIEPSLHGPPLLPSQASSRPKPVQPSALSEDWPPPAGDPEAPPAGDTLEAPVVVDTPPPSARQFSFDDILSGDNDEEPPLHPDPEPESAESATPEAIFIEPMPVAAGEPVPTDTGSISVVDQAYEEELPDDVDETDRVSPAMGAVSVDAAGVAVVTGAIIHPPSGPISTVRIPEHEVVLSDGEPVRMRVFSLEENGLEPTPIDQRVGRSARLFWLWFASNSSILSLGLGATVFAVGMSLRQSVVSVLAGVALSFIPLGLTTLAGKRSGQPTMVVSRATFGLLGNIVPAILALVTRLFWGAVLLWLLASSVAVVLVGAALDGGMGDRQLLLISLAVAFLVALLVAFAGYPLFARIQLILSVISAILVVGLIALTWKYVDVSAALTATDGPWVLTISGTVLVFSFVGLVWANSGADLARYQRPGSSGAASMLWATIGTTLPTFVLIAYGALLAASDKGIASGFLASPLDTLTLMLPDWYPVPLLAATTLSLLSGVILTLYSGGFALQAIGVRVRRQWSIVIVAVLLAGLALLLSFGVTGGMTELFRDAATTLAVPTAAWAGIFAAETMIRNRRFESQSLLVRGGIYADVRWLNLIALVVISAIGFGLTTATITWLGWQGYGFTLLGMPLDSDLAASDIGVLVALVLGILVPLVAGVPAIRRQEAMRPNI